MQKLNTSSILDRAIKKAVDGGWKRPAHITFTNNKGDFYFPMGESADVVVTNFSIRTLLLDHDFAKALWPGEPERESGMPYSMQPVPYWKMHLEQMVIADDPIKYLEENLDD